MPGFLAVSPRILAFDFVNDPTFLLNRDLIFWSYQVLTKDAKGFEKNVNTTFFKDLLKNLRDPTVVMEHNRFLSAGGS